MQIFPESSLLSTEFDKVMGLVEARCISPMGVACVKQVEVLTDLTNINTLLQRVVEMKFIVTSSLPFPTTGYMDISKELGLLRIENSVLSESQFTDIRTMVQTIREIYSFFKNRRQQFQYLEDLLNPVPFEPAITREIDAIIDEYGAVKTSASAELAAIRRNLQRSRAECDRIYTQVINKYRKQDWLTESEESSRNGRRVIAIFSEHKRSVKGIIHDSSATGKTSFVEPEEALEINNAIANLEFEERQEINRILKLLSETLRQYSGALMNYHNLLGVFDFNRAKGKLAHELDAGLPQLTNAAVIDLKEALHPLLLIHNKPLNKATVPFTLSLNEQNRILVISGPNAGGKTVCMKTAGLLQMMLQSGLLVSAHADSKFGIFENIMVDMGDSQSIEYELSTYSSRLRNMRIFLERINNRSLFLIDEFGTGTDPNLGGALAEAVLEELNNRKAIGIITTHYLNLKVFADKTDGIINGSMEFDLKQLKPLYRLVTGKPGSSYTFLVAERSGLPPSIIKNARRKVTRKNLMLEKLLTDVQREKEQLRQRTVQIQEQEKSIRELSKKYESLSKTETEKLSLKEQKLKKLEERILRESEEKFKSFLKEWRKAKDKKPVLDKYYKQFVRKKQVDKPEVLEKKRREKLKLMQSVIFPGTRVRLQNGHTAGVVEQVDHDKAFVVFGNVKAVCDLVNLELIE